MDLIDSWSGLWTGDQRCRKTATYIGQHKHRRNAERPMSRVAFEATVPVFERTKTFHALDRAATVIGSLFSECSILWTESVFVYAETLCKLATHPFLSSHECAVRYLKLAVHTRSKTKFAHKISVVKFHVTNKSKISYKLCPVKFNF
jgi:hypothetical protein